MTDNKNRTVAEIRKVFEKNNGVMGAGGTAQWAFEKKGIILTQRKPLDRGSAPWRIAVGAGADDYTDMEEEWQVLTAPTSLDPVLKALEDAKIAVKTSSLGFVPKNKKQVTGRDAEVCLNLFDTLDDHDDVQNVYADFEISDEEIARIAG